MKYMIMLYGSQQDYDVLSGKPGDQQPWRDEDVAAMHAFMEKWNNDLVESGSSSTRRACPLPSTPGGSSCATAFPW
ncbi:YciI family protein [Nonomuraea recticatena]|uniref:hypothetical protein n=1 Tax=Nonomuraea recticatena TaxID=46178 RepID=UPI003618B9B2